jgi:hypothetical protein
LRWPETAHDFWEYPRTVGGTQFGQATAGYAPGCVKTRTTGRQSINFSRFSAVFRHYRLSEAKKFASDAPFSDNFQVFTQPGPRAAINLWIEDEPIRRARSVAILHLELYANTVRVGGR